MWEKMDDRTWIHLFVFVVLWVCVCVCVHSATIIWTLLSFSTAPTTPNLSPLQSLSLFIETTPFTSLPTEKKRGKRKKPLFFFHKTSVRTVPCKVCSPLFLYYPLFLCHITAFFVKFYNVLFSYSYSHRTSCRLDTSMLLKCYCTVIVHEKIWKRRRRKQSLISPASKTSCTLLLLAKQVTLMGDMLVMAYYSVPLLPPYTWGVRCRN